MLQDYIFHILQCATHMFFRVFQSHLLYVYNVSAEHSVSDAGFLFLGAQNLAGIACTSIGDETYFPLSSPEASLVTLHRLVWSLPTPDHGPFANIKNLSNVSKSWPLLFRGDLLQVSDWNSTTRSHAIVSLRASGGALSEKSAVRRYL